MIHSFVRWLVPIEHVEHEFFKGLGSPHKLWTILDSIRQVIDVELKRRLNQIQQIAVIEDGWTESVTRSSEGIWAVNNTGDGEYGSFCIGQIPLKKTNPATMANAIGGGLLELGTDTPPLL
jgi:hypothetical protein